eukprot:5908619-Prymnesium_polylepis.1
MSGCGRKSRPSTRSGASSHAAVRLRLDPPMRQGPARRTWPYIPVHGELRADDSLEQGRCSHPFWRQRRRRQAQMQQPACSCWCDFLVPSTVRKLGCAHRQCPCGNPLWVRGL